MKANELSKKTHVSTETIRMYRNQKLLIPTQNPDNKYYDYSTSDLMSLLFIRKLRGSNLSLDAIAYTYENSDVSDLMGNYEAELEIVDEKIRKMKRQRDMLKLTLDHLELYREESGITEREVTEDKYDIYTATKENREIVDLWIREIEFFTQTLFISKELLEATELPEKVPVKNGIGTYANIIQEHKYPIPKEVICCPKGTYVTCPILMEEVGVIDREQLEPLRNYIREHNYRITSDTTAFLLRVEHLENKNRFHFRLRVRVEKETERT